LSLEIKTFSSQNNNILIPSFSNSTLPQIIWKIQVQKSFKPLHSQILL
jgi:hypothetical protein